MLEENQNEKQPEGLELLFAIASWAAELNSFEIPETQLNTLENWFVDHNCTEFMTELQHRIDVSLLFKRFRNLLSILDAYQDEDFNDMNGLLNKIAA